MSEADRAKLTKAARQGLEQAEQLYGEGRYGDCETVAENALDVAPDNVKKIRAELLKVAAFSEIALGKTDESKASFRTLLQIDPQYELDLYRTASSLVPIDGVIAERAAKSAAKAAGPLPMTQMS